MSNLAKFLILANSLLYTGGNNGYAFAKFLYDNQLLANDLSREDYYRIAESIESSHSDYAEMIKSDIFWEDFAYTLEVELKINLVV